MMSSAVQPDVLLDALRKNVLPSQSSHQKNRIKPFLSFSIPMDLEEFLYLDYGTKFWASGIFLYKKGGICRPFQLLFSHLISPSFAPANSFPQDD